VKQPYLYDSADDKRDLIDGRNSQSDNKAASRPQPEIVAEGRQNSTGNFSSQTQEKGSSSTKSGKWICFVGYFNESKSNESLLLVTDDTKEVNTDDAADVENR